MFNKLFQNFSIGISATLIFISCFFIPVLASSENNIDFTVPNTDFEDINLSGNFSWPAPGYKTITCKFGYRVAPTTGASTFHSGIDIAVPTRKQNNSCIFSEL